MMRAHDPRLIRLVAGRYTELQGLHTVADAVLLSIYFGGLFVATTNTGERSA